jgi:hypothetical protein
MWSRRQFLARGLGLTGLAVGTNALLAVNRDNLPDGSASRGMITPKAERAIHEGLEYLARHQHRDGSFGTNNLQGSMAVTSLAALAFMSGGHQPGRNQYGLRVTEALKYVLKHAEPLPQIGTYLSSRGAAVGFGRGMFERMYGHGFATLFLGEVYGMVQDKDLRGDLRKTLREAVRLIVNTQNHEGGWRYEPNQHNGADISVTICQIMALRSARNAGISVPKATVDSCIKYVKACQNQRTPDAPIGLSDGGFRYTKGFGPSGFARSAAGVVALHSAGVYQGPEVEAGLKYLMQFKPGAQNLDPNWGNRDWREMQAYYFYGHYYAAQAMWTAGGKYWQAWFPAIRDELLASNERRQADHWSDRFCAHYATAMALIILQIPNNYLPILQK